MEKLSGSNWNREKFCKTNLINSGKSYEIICLIPHLICLSILLEKMLGLNVVIDLYLLAMKLGIGEITTAFVSL